MPIATAVEVMEEAVAEVVEEAVAEVVGARPSA
jgi:hypothetical protein